jgi:hypothetical protein
MKYEDANMSRIYIYMVYSGFKGAFGGMDHIILFSFRL